MVWNSVAEEQQKLSEAVEDCVAAGESTSSYQLSLEHEKVRDRIAVGLKQLQPLVDSHADAVGFVLSINGELNSAEIYGSHDLLARLWEKLLTAAVTEAVAESGHRPATKAQDLSADALEAFIRMEKGAAKERRITSRVLVREFHDPQKSSFETEDLGRNSARVHASVLSN